MINKGLVFLGKEALAVVMVSLAVQAGMKTSFSPLSWAALSLVAWLTFANQKGWRRLDGWETRLMLWGLCSILFFVQFLRSDPSFTSWSSVYYFCGPSMEYCTWRFTWNVRGWQKATILWNFMLSSAIALQKLILEVGLGGLLPGEEAVTRESFISVGWRLVPFWLNRWESNFGAECSSILFELPHFSLELLVVLPLVQIICGRLRIVGMPHVQAGQPRAPPEGGILVPNVLHCAWEHDPTQRKLMPRLKANIRIMSMIALVMSIAGFNALVVPLALEHHTGSVPRSQHILQYEAELKVLMEAGRSAELGSLLLRKTGSDADEDGPLKLFLDQGKRGDGVLKDEILLVPRYWLPVLEATST